MPELPDLQVFSLNLQKKLKGKIVKQVVIHVSKKLNQSAQAIKTAVEGAKLQKVNRQGKELHFCFGNGHVLAMHLMLHGNIYLFEQETGAKNAIVSLVFYNRSELVLTDWQKNANVFLDPEPNEAPDALSIEININWLKKALKRKVKIKTLIMDQHIIRGIGNAYADEILWHAGIAPLSISSKIPANKIEHLAKAIPKVLNNAIETIQKNHPDLINGEIRDFLVIHNSDKKESPTGAIIKKDKVNGRTTYFTDEQQLFE